MPNAFRSLLSRRKVPWRRLSSCVGQVQACNAHAMHHEVVGIAAKCSSRMSYVSTNLGIPRGLINSTVYSIQYSTDFLNFVPRSLLLFHTIPSLSASCRSASIKIPSSFLIPSCITVSVRVPFIHPPSGPDKSPFLPCLLETRDISFKFSV